jgi:hypothetical protein
MKNEVLAHVNLVRFENHSEVEMGGSVDHILALTAAFVDELAKKIDESPQNVLREVNSRITQARILKVLKGGRS